jgi:hypothetical protein
VGYVAYASIGEQQYSYRRGNEEVGFWITVGFHTEIVDSDAKLNVSNATAEWYHKVN